MKKILALLFLASPLCATQPINNVVIQNGGTPITGLVKANGTSPATAAVPGTDFGNVYAPVSITSGYTAQWNGTSGTLSAIANTGTGSYVLTASPVLTTPTINGLIALQSGYDQTFVPNLTVSGLNVGAVAGDPGTLADGDIWYNSSTGYLRAYINGTAVNLSGSGGSGNVYAPVSITNGYTAQWNGTGGTLASVVNTGTGSYVLSTSPTLTTPAIDGLFTLQAGYDQTFVPNTSVSGLNVGAVSGDPAILANGDIWYNSSSGFLKAYINGTTVSLSGSGGTGSVTSVAATVPSFMTIGGTPITTTGTLAFGFGLEPSNLVFSGPSSGSAAAPAFRSLVNNDLPTSGVSASTYGSSTTVPQIAVNAQGLITSASNVSVTAGASPAGGATDVQYYATSSALGGISALQENSSSGALTNNQASLGATPTAGYTYTNPTAATSTVMQYSPSIIQSGQGWKTTATAASQTAETRFYEAPSSSTSQPNALWNVDYQVNGGGWTTAFQAGLSYQGIFLPGIYLPAANWLGFDGPSAKYGMYFDGEYFDIVVAGAFAIQMQNSTTTPNVIDSTSQSVSTGSGALVIDGGLGIAKDVFIGGIEHPIGGLTQVTTPFSSVTTTLANVTGLSSNVLGGKTYTFHAVLHCTPDAVGGQQFAIGGSCTATSIIYQINSIENSTNAFVINSRETALGASASSVGGTATYTEINGTIIVNGAGNLGVEFSQSTASGTSTVLIGSTFEVKGF